MMASYPPQHPYIRMLVGDLSGRRNTAISGLGLRGKALTVDGLRYNGRQEICGGMRVSALIPPT
jgi:hypothetical protein